LTRFVLTVLGSSSATPTSVRNPSAQLVNIDERLLLIDCGEGTQLQLRKLKIKLPRIRHVFISHLHGDHFFGLVGLISTMHLYGRTEDLTVYGPKGIQELVQIQLDASQTRLLYPLHFRQTNPDSHELLLDEKSFTVSSFPLDHRIATTGFLVREKPKSLRVRKDVLLREDIPLDKIPSIKAGEDYIRPDGKRIANQDITFAALPPRSFAYCSDTRYNENYFQYIKGVDLLYHEATFLHDLKEVAYEKFHTTCFQAASVALAGGAGHLLLGHYSARYKDLNPLLAEATAVFPNTTLAYDGLSLPIESNRI
jgi:ribonuclease Z